MDGRALADRQMLTGLPREAEVEVSGVRKTRKIPAFPAAACRAAEGSACAFQ